MVSMTGPTARHWELMFESSSLQRRVVRTMVTAATWSRTGIETITVTLPRTPNLLVPSRGREGLESALPLIDRRHAKVWISMSQPPLTGPRSRPRGNSTPSCDTSSMSAFLIFVGINRFWAARLLLERRSVQLRKTSSG